MCGIAGILYKDTDKCFNVGQSLVEMLDGCQHRGKDSTGFALYHKSTPGQLHLRFFVGDDDGTAAAIGRVRNILDEFGAVVVEDERKSEPTRQIESKLQIADKVGGNFDAILTRIHQNLDHSLF